MHWAIVTHPDQVQLAANGRSRLLMVPMVIAEHCLPAAIGQGWIVLARDSDFPDVPTHVSFQSNPRRYADDDVDPDHYVDGV